MHPAKTYAATVDPRTFVAFRALVEAIIPGSPVIGGDTAAQSVGAVDLCIHEYMIWELDHSLSLAIGFGLTDIPLASPTAQLLNAGAIHLAASGQMQHAPNHLLWGSSPFAALNPTDRIRVLAMLEQGNIDPGALPPPYRNDLGFTRYMIDFLNRQTMFGNYSEWSAYGTTRLRTPTERRLEFFPAGWQQAEYPGVVPGYRALLGYKLIIERRGGESAVE
ncbi:hypothetical protein D3C76_175570 [compost metagenome]